MKFLKENAHHTKEYPRATKKAIGKNQPFTIPLVGFMSANILLSINSLI